MFKEKMVLGKKNDEELISEISMFYRSLFTSKGEEDNSEVLRGISQPITEEMNSNLTKPVHEEEIRSCFLHES